MIIAIIEHCCSHPSIGGCSASDGHLSQQDGSDCCGYCRGCMAWCRSVWLLHASGSCQKRNRHRKTRKKGDARRADPLSLFLSLSHSLSFTPTHSHSLPLTLIHSHSLSFTPIRPFFASLLISLRCSPLESHSLHSHHSHLHSHHHSQHHPHSNP